jgi:tRNA pseudouridine55 synthase
MARKGKQPELKAKVLVIDCIELQSFSQSEITVRVVCSKGTYIRALARDIGAALGSGGHLTALRRTRVGNVTLDDCLTVEQAAELIHTVDIEMPEDSAN